jgi:hypothetical protein
MSSSTKARHCASQGHNERVKAIALQLRGALRIIVKALRVNRCICISKGGAALERGGPLCCYRQWN